jgi:hypothetical protein
MELTEQNAKNMLFLANRCSNSERLFGGAGYSRQNSLSRANTSPVYRTAC